MPLLKPSLVYFGSMEESFEEQRRRMTDEEIHAEFQKHVGGIDVMRQFVRDVDSGKIKQFSWDSDISYAEFREKLLSGYYDKK